jgi:biopolymer transport protein ExbB
MKWLSALVDYGIIGLLFCLCFLTVMLAVERFLFYRGLRLEDFSSRKALELKLGRNMQIIGTVAGNSPYIGLLGTVLSIMLTFHNIGLSAGLETAEIMVSLALALKATAAGLVVAIVAVMLYNALSRKAQDLLLEWDIRREESGGA